MQEIIKDIHNSDLFGIFIEMGLGNPVSSKLCEIPGASKTVFYAENPYNDSFSRKLYDIPNRIVSLEAVHRIINSERVRILCNEDSRINTVYVSSFQIGNFNDKSTHGYIGIGNPRNPGIAKYYHISIHESLNRAANIELIRDASIHLLNDFISFEPEAWNIGLNVDGIWDENLNPSFNETFYFIGSNSSNFCYIENGKLLRLEDLTHQAKEGLIVYKGSFNPITKAHCKLMSESEKLYPNYKSCYSISLNTWGKEVDFNNVIERIKLINKLGYGVLVYGNPFFDDFHMNIMKKYDKTIVYPIGADTNNRYIESKPNLKLPNRRFIISTRKGSTFISDTEMRKISDVIEINVDISATNIRNAIIDNEEEIIKYQIPDELINELNDFKKTNYNEEEK